jgi:CheY-like chemotaxis protein
LIAPVDELRVRRRVLVVDNDQDHARTFAELVTLLGHDVAFTTDSPSALQKAIEFGPDVAFLDLGLPVLDGYVLQLRQRFGDRIKMVAVSGHGSPEHRKASREAGFDAHLTKPVDSS